MLRILTLGGDTRADIPIITPGSFGEPEDIHEVKIMEMPAPVGDISLKPHSVMCLEFRSRP